MPAGEKEVASGEKLNYVVMESFDLLLPIFWSIFLYHKYLYYSKMKSNKRAPLKASPFFEPRKNNKQNSSKCLVEKDYYEYSKTTLLQPLKSSIRARCIHHWGRIREAARKGIEWRTGVEHSCCTSAAVTPYRTRTASEWAHNSTVRVCAERYGLTQVGSIDPVAVTSRDEFRWKVLYGFQFCFFSSTRDINPACINYR